MSSGGLAGGKGLLLLRTTAASTSSINVIRHTQDANKRKRAIGALIGTGILGIVGAGMIGTIAYGMAQFGFAHVVPSCVATVVSVIALIFTMLKSNGYLYAFKDYDLLMSMPFSVRTVVGSRFLLMYLQDLPWSMLVSLAALVGYALQAHPSVGVCVVWIILTPIVPLVPTVIASLFGVLIAAIGSRSRHKNLIQTVLTFIFVIPMFFIQYIVRYLVQSDEVDAVIASSAQTFEGISKAIPTVGWFVRAVNDGDMLSFALVVVVSLALFVGLVLFMSTTYRRINTRLTSSSAHRRARGASKSYKQRTPVQTIVFKEYKRMTGSTVCSVNLGMGAVFSLLICVILPFVNLPAIVSTMAQGATVDLTPLTLAWPACVYFFVGMVPSTVPSPSLEGKNYWIIKSLPFDTMTVCKGRMLFNLLLNLVPAMFVVASGLVALRASWLELLLGLLMIVVMCLFSTAYGMRCGLKHQRLDWENEVEVVKQGSAVNFYLLPNMFGTMIIASLMFVAGILGFATIVAPLVMVVYGVLALLSYKSVQRIAKSM